MAAGTRRRGGEGGLSIRALGRLATRVGGVYHGQKGHMLSRCCRGLVAKSHAGLGNKKQGCGGGGTVDRRPNRGKKRGELSLAAVNAKCPCCWMLDSKC